MTTLPTRPAPDSPVLCGAPFVAMEFDPFGNVQVCCSNALYPLGNVARDSLDEIWRGARATTMRKAMEEGDFSRGCVVCRHRLTFPGGEVPRDYYDNFPVTSSVPEWPQLLSFALHNTCNLECIMCGADLSSKIRAKRTDLPPLPHVYDEQFFDDLRPYLANCRSIDMAGGEPFLVREHREIWRLLGELENPPVVSVTTNGTVWNDYVEGILASFDLNLCVSVDGITPETFELVRTGARHAEVMANLERFRAYAAERGTGVFLSFSMVRQNWFELGRVLSFAEERGIEVSVQTVIEPEFGVQHLPTPELQAVVDAMEAEGADLRPHLELNGDAWDRQVLRLRAELDERRASIKRPQIMEPPSAAHGPRLQRTVLGVLGPAGPAGLVGRLATAPADRRRLDAARRELLRWTEGRPLGEVVLDATGRIVTATLRPVLPPSITAFTLDGLTTYHGALDAIGAAVGGALWIGEELSGERQVEHLLWFGLGQEARHKEGLIFRTIAVPRHREVVVTIGADFQLLPPAASTATPVRIGARPARPAASWA
ncbi:MAG: hypothetical protein JWM47_3785 [Acidimicrobiales bacterium]|nr:hypothetical protein [Acidimicrobiales bacterium]